MSPLTPGQWAAWAITGDPTNRVPNPMGSLADRIGLAVLQAADAYGKYCQTCGSTTPLTYNQWVNKHHE